MHGGMCEAARSVEWRDAAYPSPFSSHLAAILVKSCSKRSSLVISFAASLFIGVSLLRVPPDEVGRSSLSDVTGVVSSGAT